MSLIDQAKEQMAKTVENTKENFSGIRTGRANPALLNGITVDYYGAPTPIKAVASIGVPEPRTLSVTPFDASQAGAVEKALRNSDLGISPNRDGNVIRLTMPELTEDRRKEYVKLAKDKALFADSIATSIGAICGTSNTTTYVESSAGIAAGGRTGLTSVVVAICFALSAFLAPVVSAVPSAATAGVLVIVGCMMAASLKEVKWDDIAEAIPAFFAAVFMAFSYSISYGIAGGFIMYCIVKTCKGKAKEVHPIIWTVAALFILDFVCMAIL